MERVAPQKQTGLMKQKRPLNYLRGLFIELVLGYLSIQVDNQHWFGKTGQAVSECRPEY